MMAKQRIQFTKIVEQFNDDLGSVYALMNFDKTLLDLLLVPLLNLKNYSESAQLKKVSQMTDNIIKVMTGIKSHDSTEVCYQTIFNQGVVLLVSYFAATLEDLFEHSISLIAEKEERPIWADDLVRIKIGEILDGKIEFGGLLIKAHNISFQDMKSTCDAFCKFSNCKIEHCEAMDNIIFAQACRHILVHDAGTIIGVTH
jgi:hypothetical protein